MSRPVEGPPRPEQSGSVAIAETLAKLRQNQPIGETGYFRFHMQGEALPSRPTDAVIVREEIFINPRERRADFSGTKAGDVVQGLFTVNQQITKEGKSQFYLNFENAEAVITPGFAASGTLSPSERFVLPNLSEADQTALRNLGNAQLDMQLQVTKGTAREGYNSFEDLDSLVAISRINGVQEVYDGEATIAPGLQEGSPLLVQGEFLRQGEHGTFALRLAKNMIMSFDNAWTQDSPFLQGVNGTQYLDGTDPIAASVRGDGDIVQVHTKYSERGVFPVYNRLYLHAPSTSRTQRYEKDRRQITKILDQMAEADDPRHIRGQIAQLLRKNVRDTNLSKLLPDELRQATELIEEKLPDQQDRPPILPSEWAPDVTDSELADKFAKRYGIDGFALSSKELRSPLRRMRLRASALVRRSDR